MQDDLAQQAIQAALAGNWRIAERLNRAILNQNPTDLDALLRLANATSKLGKKKEAESLYKQALRLDPYNIFATRGLSRLKKMKKGEVSEHGLETRFVEEPGKTKNVSLVYTAPQHVLANLDSGERVLLVPRRHRISITTVGGVYIGRLPDDLSVRLLGFIEGGNKYEAIIKSANSDQLKIFIRETYRSAKFEKTPSFFHEGPLPQDSEV